MKNGSTLGAIGLVVSVAASASWAQQHPSDAGVAAVAATDAGVATVPPSTREALVVVNQLQAFYNRTTDFQADFAQRSHNRLSGQDQTRNGHVSFRRPGQMRWDYQSPTGDVIVSDGTTLWAYEAAAHQAIQTNMGQSQLPSVLSFLTGTGQLANNFSFRLMNAQQMRYPTGFVLDGRPLQPNPSFEHVVFYVDGTTYQVVRTVVFDAVGNSNRFDFVNPRVNAGLLPALFQWTPPHGTQIVRP